LEGLPMTPLRKTITQTKTMPPAKKTTMDSEDLVALTMITTMTLTMTTMTTTTDVIEVVVSEGLLVDVRTVPAPPVRTIRDQTPARMGQLLPGLRLVQLEDGRGAPTTKDLSALMEADLTMGSARTQAQQHALMGLLQSVQMAAPQLQSQCVQTTLMWSFSELRGEIWPMATVLFQPLADNWRFQPNVIMTRIEIETSHSVCCYSLHIF